MLPLFLYLASCAVTGFIGRNRKFGFWGYALAALFLTPIFSIVLILASDSRSVRAQNLQRRQIASAEHMIGTKYKGQFISDVVVQFDDGRQIGVRSIRSQF